MRRTWTYLALTVVFVLASLAAITPPSKRIKLGKDLRGGVTLIYSVEVRPGESSRNVLSSVISVLKNRVDPNGLYEISMVPQGRDRIEITMPLPGPDVRAARDRLNDSINTLESTRLSPAEIDAAMSLEPAGRATRIETLAGDDPARVESARALAASFDAAAQFRRDYDEAAAAGAPESDLIGIAQRAAEAEIAYEVARDEFLGRSITGDELRAALALSDRTRLLYDEETRQQVEIPSPRRRALDRLSETYPAQKAQIDEIVRQHEAYESIRQTLDDPSDLERLLRASGVLSFRMTVDPGADMAEEIRLRRELREKGPRGVRSTDRHWFKINKIENWYNNVQEARALEAAPAEFFNRMGYIAEEYDGEYYMLCWDSPGDRLTPETDRNWRVAGAFQGVDQLGRPAINFLMDARGAQLLGQLTEKNVGNRMAVLLDDEVYTAPNLNERLTRSAQIMGEFSPDELQYIIRVLASGSLQNKLSPAPISRNVVGPELGSDYLQQGMAAGVIALISVSAFMIIYYFRCGVIAVFALAINALLMMGAMAFNNAAFTLPGIAGIILTFGQAVDANVLIYERMREELRAGKDSRAAVRLGFSKALSSIVDGNVTNLIVCIVLYYFGTQEIRGFAITLGLGIVTTLFAALITSRFIFDFLVHLGMLVRIRMLPTVFPLLERSFEPAIDWIGLRKIFIGVSAVYVGFGIVAMFIRGDTLMDTEFRGGTQFIIQLRDDPAKGVPITKTRREIEERVHAIGNAEQPGSPLFELLTAEILPLDPENDGVTSDRFLVKTAATDQQSLVNAVAREFADVLNARPPISFTADQTEVNSGAPVYPLVSPTGDLSADLARPVPGGDGRAYVGGVAIILEGLSPRPSLDDLRARLADMRAQPDFSDASSRKWEVRTLEGADDAVEAAVVLVADSGVSFLDSESRWTSDLAEREWDLARQGLTRSTTLASVQSFSAAVATSFRAQAVVSVVISLLLILIYVWVRFGSVRYSLGAVACLFHDCLTMIGFIALAQMLCEWAATEPLAASLGIMPFKIDLNMIAALLTVAGYSLNDTIIIMDRIREVRGKMNNASAGMINEAINMTISRTVITSGTTFLSLITLYMFGGEGVRGFAYAMFIGIAVGTYSSIAVAAPIVWRRSPEDQTHPHPAPAAGP